MKIQISKSDKKTIKKLNKYWSFKQNKYVKNGTVAYCEMFRNDLINRATKAELRMIDMFKYLKAPVIFQQPIYYRDYNGVWSFSIFDFYDVKNNTIIEVDGGYHQTDTQKESDMKRDWRFLKFGFNVIRLQNGEAFMKHTFEYFKELYNK